MSKKLSKRFYANVAIANILVAIFKCSAHIHRIIGMN